MFHGVWLWDDDTILIDYINTCSLRLVPNLQDKNQGTFIWTMRIQQYYCLFIGISINTYTVLQTILHQPSRTPLSGPCIAFISE